MLAKPTIFAFTTAYHPFIGGAEIAIQEIAERLKHQCRFFIITARMKRELPSREARPEGVVVRVGMGREVDKWLFLFLGPIAAFRELSRAGAGKVLLWGMDISAGSVAAAVVKRLRPDARFVLSVQYGYGGERIRRGRFGLIGRAYRFMLGSADAVTAISRFLAETAGQFGYRRRVEIIPNGAALERFRVKRTRRMDPLHPVVITTSRLVPKNGVDVLIRAIAEVQKSAPGIGCRILGDGPERTSLEALAKMLGVAGQTEFLGNVPNADLPRYLAEADIFVRPARSEGMGNAFVEALAAGLPIIGTPVEGILDIITDKETGLFSGVDDPADVARKIIELVRNPDLARRIVANGRAMVEQRFSWEAIAAAYGRLFNGQLASRILIATPMLPPDIGGPGTFAARFAGECIRSGHTVSVLRYGTRDPHPLSGVIRQISISLHAPVVLRHLRYAYAAWRMLARNDIALALDPVAVGWPLAMACRLRRKPFLIRIEGDSLWERYVSRTGEELTLRQFHDALPQLTLSRRERAWHRISRRVFSQAAGLVFSSRWREEIFRISYPLRSGPAVLILPAWPATAKRRREADRVLVFAGRFVRVKNLARLIRAFAVAAGHEWRLLLIGDGPERERLLSEISNQGLEDRVRVVPPMAHEELLKRIASAHAFVLPSLSDVSPNVILECMAAGTPFLMTRESGFHEALKDIGLFVRPLDEQDIAVALRQLCDPAVYGTLVKRLAGFRGARSWEAVASDWLKLIAEYVS